MTKHEDRRFSATLSSQDLAVVGCLASLAKFVRQTGEKDGRPTTSEKDWRRAGQKMIFRFSAALDRDLFINEVRRLLPANLVRFDDERDNNFAP
jgi:hypothetical protein